MFTLYSLTVISVYNIIKSYFKLGKAGIAEN